MAPENPDPLVTAQDVQDLLLDRTLTGPQMRVIGRWIELLLSIVRRRIPNLDTLAEDRDYLIILKSVIYTSVKRVLDNPKSLRQTTLSIDDFSRSETIDSSASTGGLYISDDQWADLIPQLDGDAFSIRVVTKPGYAEIPGVYG